MDPFGSPKAACCWRGFGAGKGGDPVRPASKCRRAGIAPALGQPCNRTLRAHWPRRIRKYPPHWRVVASKSHPPARSTNHAREALPRSPGPRGDGLQRVDSAIYGAPRLLKYRLGRSRHKGCQEPKGWWPRHYVRASMYRASPARSMVWQHGHTRALGRR